MTSRSRIARALPWSTLVLVLGLLAMHGLAGGEHAGHPAPSTTSMAASMVSTAPMPMPMPEPVVEADDRASGSGLTLGPALALQTLAVLGLCLGVLLGGALLRRGGRGWSRATPTRGPPAAVIRTSRPGRGPPRLLLAQLCVLRT